MFGNLKILQSLGKAFSIFGTCLKKLDGGTVD